MVVSGRVFCVQLVNTRRASTPQINTWPFAPSSSTFRFPKPPLCRLSRSIIDSQRHLHFPPPNFPLPAVASPCSLLPPIHPSPREISRSPRPRYPSQNQSEAGKHGDLFYELLGLLPTSSIAPSSPRPFLYFSERLCRGTMDVASRNSHKFAPREPQDIRRDYHQPRTRRAKSCGRCSKMMFRKAVRLSDTRCLE